MHIYLYIFISFIIITGIQCLVIPDEIPTLLSVVWSIIPILKTGTDARIGWGFRLGRRADFQILTELGPQQYTQPLLNQMDSSANRKRNTINSLSNTLYAQRQNDKKEKEETDSSAKVEPWVENWSKNAKEIENKKKQVEILVPKIDVGEIHVKTEVKDTGLTEVMKNKTQESQPSSDIDNSVK